MSVFYTSPVSVGGTPTPTTDGWTRPSEWLAQPTYTAGQQQIDLLIGVGENAINDISLLILTSSGTYSVNWGDGNTDTGITSGVDAEHIFNWADIPSATLMSNGMRQAMITVTADSGNISSVILNRKHSLNSKQLDECTSPIFEINASVPNTTSFTISGTSNIIKYPLLENVNIIGENLGNTAFTGIRALKNIQSYFVNNTGLQSTFQDCINLINANLTGNIVGSCASAFSGCNSLKKLPDLNFNDANSLFSFLLNAYSLQGNINFNTSLSASFYSSFNRCESVSEITVDMANGTTFNTFFTIDCFNLSKLTILNMPIGLTTLNISKSNLDVDALVDVFTSLYDRTATTAGTINITDAYGSAALSAAQREIATNKNWNITG